VEIQCHTQDILINNNLFQQKQIIIIYLFLSIYKDSFLYSYDTYICIQVKCTFVTKWLYINIAVDRIAWKISIRIHMCGNFITIKSHRFAYLTSGVAWQSGARGGNIFWRSQTETWEQKKKSVLKLKSKKKLEKKKQFWNLREKKTHKNANALFLFIYFYILQHCLLRQSNLILRTSKEGVLRT